MELATPVDSTSHQSMVGLLLKVVSEVDEMCLFHQSMYENREGGWAKSTIALLSGLQETRGVTLTTKKPLYPS
jgi:hypothetical protein